MSTNNANGIESRIDFNRSEREYDVIVNGQYVGSRARLAEAEQLEREVRMNCARVRGMAVETVKAELTAAAPVEAPEVVTETAPALVEAGPIASAFPILTRANVGQALKTARERAAADKAWINAINKAALELEAQPWRFNGSTLVIKSRTDSALRHTTNGTSCTCKAFNQETPKPCWHRAAALLLARAAALAIPPARRQVAA